MKNICFITSGVLPVPAVKGGAIEQLIQQLCEDNEKNPHLETDCYHEERPVWNGCSTALSPHSF